MKSGIGRRLRTQSMRSALVLALAGVATIAAAAHAAAGASDLAGALPIVFVHGGAGSGAQYGSVAKRFVSNGFPADRIRTFEYDSSSAAAVGGAPAALDSFIDAIRAEYAVERVNLVGHSLGTTISTAYLADPLRAAKIAHYVGVDGRSIPSCGVGDPNLDCMGIFRGSAGDVGGNNVYLNSTQSHVEAATSPESFAAQFRFFTGREPQTTLIVPEPPGQVRIAGRAVNFPQNTGADGATLLVWQVNPATGQRSDKAPVATLDIGSTGAWGPVAINGQQHYELELLRADTDLVLHLYYQPFIRSDDWVRLLSVAPGSPTLVNTLTGPNHAAAVVIRYREFWTTHPGASPDILEISTTSPSRGDEAPVNALQNVLSDGIAVGTSAIGLHLHDNPADGVSSLALIPYFGTVSFQNGADVYMPAAEPPDGTISFRSLPRGDSEHAQILNTPNWASVAHRISVNLNDYVQDVNSWGECKRLKPTLCK
jgi:pimeloyl-ACP methyl ester carboxylesterase